MSRDLILSCNLWFAALGARVRGDRTPKVVAAVRFVCGGRRGREERQAEGREQFVLLGHLRREGRVGSAGPRSGD